MGNSKGWVNELLWLLQGVLIVCVKGCFCVPIFFNVCVCFSHEWRVAHLMRQHPLTRGSIFRQWQVILDAWCHLWSSSTGEVSTTIVSPAKKQEFDMNFLVYAAGYFWTLMVDLLLWTGEAGLDGVLWQRNHTRSRGDAHPRHMEVSWGPMEETLWRYMNVCLIQLSQPLSHVGGNQFKLFQENTFWKFNCLHVNLFLCSSTFFLLLIILWLSHNLLQLLQHHCCKTGREKCVQYCWIPGHDEVFIKDMPFRYRSYMDLGTLDEVIPQNYVHVFLIRNPLKAIPSLFKLIQKQKSVPYGKSK